MPRISLSFNIDEIPHNGSCFLLAAKESLYSGFCIPIQSTATAFHRILYKLDKIALSTVIPIEYNSLLVTFYNLPTNKAKQLCESAISMHHSSITFTIQESKFEFDQYMVKAAYEALITRALEELGWWPLNENGSIILYNPRGVEISDFKISSNPSLQQASQFLKKSNGSNNKISISMSGRTTYKQLPIFKIQNKLLQKIYKEKGFVDLDYVPCIVLPKFRNAFVVRVINADTRLSKKTSPTSINTESKSSTSMDNKNEQFFPSMEEIQEIKDYWLYTHGIFLLQVSAILKVSFVKGGESLTYPIECVIDQNPCSNLEMKIKKADFENKLENYISTTINVVTLNQRSKSQYK